MKFKEDKIKKRIKKKLSSDLFEDVSKIGEKFDFKTDPPRPEIHKYSESPFTYEDSYESKHWREGGVEYSAPKIKYKKTTDMNVADIVHSVAVSIKNPNMEDLLNYYSSGVVPKEKEEPFEYDLPF
jgi:hypothetical protein